MIRVLFVMALAVPIGFTGCGSSDGKKPASMGEVGAALEKQAAAGGTTAAVSENPAGTSTASASGTSPPTSAEANDPPVASADPSLASKRGYALTDWSNEAAYVLVKADAAKAAEMLAAAMKGKVVKDVFGTKVDENANQTVVYQLAGHPWSIFACHNMQLEELIPALSRDAEVLYFWNSDFNGWAGVQLHRGGQEVEAVHWGPEGDGLGEDADASKWQASGTVSHTYEGITSNETYLFRSTLRKVSPQELAKGEAFVNELFQKHDAYLPDVDQMPWFDYDTKTITSPLGAGAFAAVHAVEVPDP